MRYIIKPAAILFLTAVVTVAALSFVYNRTLEPIEKQKHKAQEKAMSELMPRATGYREIQIEKTGSITAVYESIYGNDVFGYIFMLSPEGYSGAIDFVLSISEIEYKVMGIRILRHSETPGLGALAANEEFFGQYEQLELSPLTVVKTSPRRYRNEIQAITGATITSRAVTNAVNEAIEWYNNYKSQIAPEYDQYDHNDQYDDDEDSHLLYEGVEQ